MIIAPGGFRDEELFEPKKILERNGVEVDVASIREGRFKGMLGGEMEAKSIENLNLDDYDGVIFVGGVGVIESKMFDNKKLHEIAIKFLNEGKIVGAECVSPVILAKAGILKGKKATVWKSDFTLEEFKKCGVEYVEENVVVDGNIITGAGPFAAREFGEKFLELLNERLSKS